MKVWLTYRASLHSISGYNWGFSRTLRGSECFHEPRRRTRARKLQASSTSSSTWTRVKYPLVCFYVICCVILASVAVLLVFPALASAGPDHHLRFFRSTIWEVQSPAFIKDRQPHGNGMGRYFQPFLTLYFHRVVSQGAPDSEVVRSRESVRIPGILSTLALCAGWLVGRQRQNLIGLGAYWYAG